MSPKQSEVPPRSEEGCVDDKWDLNNADESLASPDSLGEGKLEKVESIRAPLIPPPAEKWLVYNYYEDSQDHPLLSIVAVINSKEGNLMNIPIILSTFLTII